MRGAPALEYNVKLIEDEIHIARVTLIRELARAGKLPKDDLMQSIRNKDLIKKGIIEENGITIDPLKDNAKYIQIPKVTFIGDAPQLEYVGPPALTKSMTVYTNHNFRNHKYRLVSCKKPYAFLDLETSEDMHNLYIFEYPSNKITIRGIFDNPVAVPGAYDDVNYPAPGDMKDTIIKRLADRYISEYKKANDFGYPMFRKA